MSTDCVHLALTRKNEYFIPEDAIAREVIEEDITRYLGNDATVRVGIQENPQTKEIQKGYYIDAYRNLTKAMLEDLKTDSETWEAERLQSIHVTDYNCSNYCCSDSNYYSTVPDPGIYPPAAPANADWHVPRDLYEAHCSQLEEHSAPPTREDSYGADSEDEYRLSTSMGTQREFECSAPPLDISTNTYDFPSIDPDTSSLTVSGNTAYDPRRPFLLSDGFGDLAPISCERQFYSALNPEFETPLDAKPTLHVPAHLNAMRCNLECCDIPKTFGPSGKHISRDSYPKRKLVCGPVAEVPSNNEYIETLNANNPVSSIESPSTGLYEATPSYSPVSCEFPPSPWDTQSNSKSMSDKDRNVNLPQASYPTHAARGQHKENVGLARPPFRVLWSPEPYPSFKLTSSKQHAYSHNNNNAKPTSSEDQEAMDIQDSTPAAPPSPSPEQPNPQPATWADLPLVPYVPPAKKGMPILLNGRYIRARADFWISSSIINADFAKAIGATINFGAVCLPLKLPTLNNYVRPVGVASILLKFPQEEGEGRMVDFIVIENFVYQAVLGGPLLRNLDEAGEYLSERPSQTRNIPICAFLGQGYQKIKCLVGDQEVVATADTGSEVNLMSFDFATRNGFDMDAITPEDDGRIRFSNGSVQSVNSVVSLPVSFGSGAPPSQLLKLVGSALSPTSRARRTEDYASGLPNVGANVSILVDFLVLEGLAVDVILGQDVLATAREFSSVSLDVFDGNSIANAIFHGVSPVETVANTNSGDTEIQTRPSEEESVKKQDMDEIARYEKERERARKLLSKEKRRAERSNEKKRREYNRKRAETGAGSGSNTLHYHLCPCKLHSLDKSN